MSNQEASDELEIEDQVHFCFARASILRTTRTTLDPLITTIGQRTAVLGFSADLLSSRLALQSEVMSPELCPYAGSGCQDADPIFIVGLQSRVGLLEQILAGHTQVDGTRAQYRCSGLSVGRAPSDFRSTTLPLLLEDIDALN